MEKEVEISRFSACAFVQPASQPCKSQRKSIGMCFDHLGSGIRINKEKVLNYPNDVLYETESIG